MADTEKTQAETEAELLEQAQAAWPGKEVKFVDFASRRMIAIRPSQGQVAAMARLGRSTRVDDITRISNLLDMLEAFLASQADRDWLSDRLLGGEMDFGGMADEDEADTAMGLLTTIAQAWQPEGDNREERRAVKKARRVAPKA